MRIFLSKYTYFICVTLMFLSSNAYAVKIDGSHIKEPALKQSDDLLQDLCIKLLNGKSRFALLDDMVKVIKAYKVVEILSPDLISVKDMIIRETAYRMLKEEYLPHIRDKIKVFSDKDRKVFNEGRVIFIYVTITQADSDKRVTASVDWSNLVHNISKAVNRLKISRFYGVETGCAESIKADFISNVMDEIRQMDSGNKVYSKYEPSFNVILSMIQNSVNQLFKDGLIQDNQQQIVYDIFVKLIMLTQIEHFNELAEEISKMRSLDDLRIILKNRIEKVSMYLQLTEPSDYGALVMLNSIWDNASKQLYDISFKTLSNYNSNKSYSSA